MKQYILDLTAYSLFVMTAGWVVVNFLCIVFKGQTVIGFENYALNISELAFALAILGLAIERWLKFVRR